MSRFDISYVIISSMSYHIYLVKMIVQKTCVKIILQIISKRYFMCFFFQIDQSKISLIKS